MNYNFLFNIEKDDYKVTSKVVTKKVTYGTIKRVIISNPAGSVGTSHLQVYFHEFQIFPLNKGEWYSGEKIKVDFDADYELYTAPYELKFKGLNTGLYNHAFYINISIMREDLGREGGGDVKGLTGMEGKI